MTNYSFKKTIAIGFMIATFALSASAQIKIGNIKIGGPNKPDPNKPDPNRPPTTNPPNTTPPNPHGKRTGTSNNSNKETGATREQVTAFKNDMKPYAQGMNNLLGMERSVKSDSVQGCRDAQMLRQAMTEGAAFAEIIKTKYPNIENPSWAYNEDLMVGDYRRRVENREQLAKNCVTALIAAEVRNQLTGLEKSFANFKTESGLVVSEGFVARLDDPAERHAKFMERFKEVSAMVGLTMPDETIFAAYDKLVEDFNNEAKKHADRWDWPGTNHDPMIEAKARGWFKNRHPKGQIGKIGMMHSTWEIDKGSNGIPEGRFKRGYIMFRYPGVEPCLVTKFSYEQDYMGGGRYNEMAITSGLSGGSRFQTCK